MKFTDSELQRCYESNLATDGTSTSEFSKIRALLAAHETFVMFEGAHSTRVHETIDLLLSPELRPGLHRWYQDTKDNLDSTALSFRDHLSRLAGEQLESVEEISHNPT